MRGGRKGDRLDRGLKPSHGRPPPPRPDLGACPARALARLPTCLGSAVRCLCRCYHCRDSSPARRFGLVGRSGRLCRRQPLFAAPAFAWQASLPAAAAAASLPACAACAASGIGLWGKGAAGARRGPAGGSEDAHFFAAACRAYAPALPPRPHSIHCTRPRRAIRRTMHPEAATRRRPAVAFSARDCGHSQQACPRQQRAAAPPLLPRRKGAVRLRYLRQQRAAAPPPPPTVPPGPGPAAQPCGGNARLPGALARLSVPPVQEPVAPAIILLYAPPRTGRRRKPRRPPGSFRLAHRPQRGAPAPSRRRAANRGARQRPASPKRVCVT